jgi:hypothetical protein
MSELASDSMPNIFINIKFDFSKRSFFDFIKCQKSGQPIHLKYAPLRPLEPGVGFFL